MAPPPAARPAPPARRAAPPSSARLAPPCSVSSRSRARGSSAAGGASCARRVSRRTTGAR
eukprot:5670690-Prymnesium_polylepis.1